MQAISVATLATIFASVAAAQENLPAPRLAPPVFGPRSFLISAPPQAGQPQQVIDESVPAPSSTGTSIAPTTSLPAPMDFAPARRPPHVVYDTDREARRMYAGGSVNLVMVAENPADKCLYEIPICIPACCTGAPSVHSYLGLFGRGVVEYCWPCGFRAIVKFRNIGDVRVDYEGD
jgi:hypothetical protein